MNEVCNKLDKNCWFLFYAPPTIVEGHYVFWSVASSVRSFVCPVSRLKFLVEVFFDEVEVQST